MNNTIKKIIKGTIAIFAIKLVIVSGLLIFQSCQSETIDSPIQEKAKSNFLLSINESKSDLNTIKISTSKNNTGTDIITRDMNGEKDLICLMAFNGAETTNEAVAEIVDNISTLTELMSTKDSYNLATQFDLTWTGDEEGSNEGSSENENIDMAETEFDSEDCIALIEIPLQPVVDAIEPTIEDAKNYLISKGFTNSDIQNLFTADEDGPAIEEYNLVPTIMMLIAEEQNTNATTSVNFASVFGNSMYASEIGECAGDALGISAIAAVINEGLHTSAGKKLLKKAIRKVASRPLGWIGAAIFVYEFGDCMEWW